MNRAYRGIGPDAGWNTETDYIEGNRINEDQLSVEMAGKVDAALLLWRRTDGTLLGCVWMEPEPEDVWYLGSLTIAPREQNGGLGRKLLAAAEGWALARGAREIRMTVVNVRAALRSWYARRGYLQTGETEPFPYDDDRFGTPKRTDLHFVVLRKPLA